MAHDPTRVRARRASAVMVGKLSAAASRLLGRGGGTALPGLVAERLDPHIVEDLAAQLAGGSVVVSGTNGKTTTARMVATILSDAGLRPLRNESGSNLMRGLASSLVREANLWGNLSSGGRELGLFEVDEAALPEVLKSVVPRCVLLLDLFRDQLDRYGEVATVARLWSAAIRELPVSTNLVANADDPLVANVLDGSQVDPVYFGVESAERGIGTLEHASDVKACPRCGGRIEYNQVFLGHLGHYACQECDLRRPAPTVRAEEVRLKGVEGSEFRLVMDDVWHDVALPLPGLYNVYNALAAAGVASTLGIKPADIAASLRSVTPAFGRMERVTVDGRDVVLALAKNPAGLNEVLRTIAAGEASAHLLVMLNDNTADGRDVSWIWDADVEMLRGGVASVVFGGLRAEDMALRFKYAGLFHADENLRWEIVRDTERAFRHALSLTPPDDHLFIVPTYTALLDIRGVLARLGHVRPYWEE